MSTNRKGTAYFEDQSLELVKKVAQNCPLCGKPGHNKKTCEIPALGDCWGCLKFAKVGPVAGSRELGGRARRRVRGQEVCILMIGEKGREFRSY